MLEKSRGRWWGSGSPGYRQLWRCQRLPERFVSGEDIRGQGLEGEETGKQTRKSIFLQRPEVM